MKWPRFSKFFSAIPSNAQLSDSVPPDVKTISSLCAPIVCAISDRALSKTMRLVRPISYGLEALEDRVLELSKAARADAEIGVVAALSK